MDVRQFEFIQYDLGRHQEFLAKLDNAIRSVFVEPYEDLFKRAREILQRFNANTGLQCQQKALDEFQQEVMIGEKMGGIPSEDEEDSLAQFLLPKIIANFTDPLVIKKYNEWVSTPSADHVT